VLRFCLFIGELPFIFTVAAFSEVGLPWTYTDRHSLMCQGRDESGMTLLTGIMVNFHINAVATQQHFLPEDFLIRVIAHILKQ
jgi:hypothetical protein